ncbi:hypothetical protein [Pseudomonas sp. NPDC096950]|uniref:hypothetical protein n=1 Tax=Pseudomonas sp. NPDC096950 TaxID=3364485 RepID=UPI00383AA154
MTTNPSDPQARIAELEAQLEQLKAQAQCIAWETDAANGLTQYLTAERYSQIHPRFRKHYRPYRCSACSQSQSQSQS